MSGDDPKGRTCLITRELFMKRSRPWARPRMPCGELVTAIQGCAGVDSLPRTWTGGPGAAY